MVDRENRIAANVANMTNQITSGVTLMPHHLQSTYPNYPGNEVPFVQVVLSPIQELEGSNSVNNTLHPGQPSTAALAQAVLTPGLGPVITPVSLPMTVSQLTSLGLAQVNGSPLLSRNLNQANSSPTFIHNFAPQSKPPSPATPSKITEIVTDEEIDNKSSGNSDASCSSKDSKELETNFTNSTPSAASKKFDEDMQLNGGTEIVNLAPKTAPSSIISVNSDDGYRSRKVSAASHQNVPVGTPKRGEVYV